MTARSCCGVACLALVACTSPRAPVPVTSEWQYAVEADARELRVTASFPPSQQPRALIVPDDALRFVRDVEVDSGDGFARSEPLLPACTVCRVRYRFALAEAADALEDEDVARAAFGAFLGAPSAWLLHPKRAAPGTGVRFVVHGAAGLSFLAGNARDGDAWVASAETFAESPTAIVGAFDAAHVEVAGGAIDVAVPRSAHAWDMASTERWMKRAGGAVGAYFGSFPVSRALVVLLPRDGKRVGFGRTSGGAGATIVVDVGRDADDATLKRDWVLAHEMVHLGFPWLDRQHHWLEEGIATYVEPIARARVGLTTTSKVWRDLVENVPYGLPRDGDLGLDRTATWGRTYWGGALYCLLVDVEIRKRTHNAKSLDDALRAIRAKGGTILHSWPIEKVLAVGDAATGTTVMRELYDAMATKPLDVDLDALWKRLGVQVEGGDVRFDEHAELANVRRAIAE